MGDTVFPLEELKSIPAGTRAEVTVRIRQSSTSYSLDTYSPLTEIYRESTVLSPLYRTTREEPVSFVQSGNQVTISLNSQVNGVIDGDIEIITPRGGVDTVRFAPQSL